MEQLDCCDSYGARRGFRGPSWKVVESSRQGGRRRVPASITLDDGAAGHPRRDKIRHEKRIFKRDPRYGRAITGKSPT